MTTGRSSSAVAASRAMTAVIVVLIAALLGVTMWIAFGGAIKGV